MINSENLNFALNFILSMFSTVIIMSVLGFSGSWIMVRLSPCNPAWYDPCRCGCNGDACREKV